MIVPVSRWPGTALEGPNWMRPWSRAPTVLASIVTSGPARLPRTKNSEAKRSGDHAFQPVKYPNWTDRTWGLSPSDGSRYADTISVARRDSLGRRWLEPG